MTDRKARRQHRLYSYKCSPVRRLVKTVLVLRSVYDDGLEHTRYWTDTCPSRVMQQAAKAVYGRKIDPKTARVPMRKSIRWTPHMDGMIVKYYGSNVSTAEIAALLSKPGLKPITKNAVIGRYRKLKEKGRVSAVLRANTSTTDDNIKR